MFWSSDPITSRRTQRTDNRSFKSSSNPTQSNSFYQNKVGGSTLHNDLSQKVQKFMTVNKSHHFDEVCVCEDCISVKRLQRYESLKMDLSKNSSYRVQYNKNNLKKNQNKVQGLSESMLSIQQQEGSTGKNPYVHLNSVYRNQYASRSVQKVDKPRPSDELKFRGPSTSFSSYQQMYSNGNGPSQYVIISLKQFEPIKLQTLPPIKFKAQSLYSNEFKATKTVETQSGKTNDQLKLGKPSMVKQSTHRSQYANPENYYFNNQRHNSMQKRIQPPNFSYQYKTINQDQFEKPAQKKNCRNKRYQILHGQLVTSQNLSTIA